MPLEWMPVGHRPRVAGWYWCVTPNGRLDMVEAAKNRYGEMLDQEGDALFQLSYDKCRFAGPIPTPTGD